MHTVLIGKQKGGIGATTIVRELAVAAVADGRRVALIDLDPQHTLSKWWNRRTAGAEGLPNPALATPTPETIGNALSQLVDVGVDLVLVDTPPSVHPFIASVLRLADVVLVPTRPTTDDIDALPPVLQQIEDAAKPFAFVLSQAQPGRSRLLDDSTVLLARRGRVAPGLRLRAAFPTAAAAGGTAYEAGGKGADEVGDLWGWLREDLDRSTARKSAKDASALAC